MTEQERYYGPPAAFDVEKITGALSVIEAGPDSAIVLDIRAAEQLVTIDSGQYEVLALITLPRHAREGDPVYDPRNGEHNKYVGVVRKAGEKVKADGDLKFFECELDDEGKMRPTGSPYITSGFDKYGDRYDGEIPYMPAAWTEGKRVAIDFKLQPDYYRKGSHDSEPHSWHGGAQPLPRLVTSPRANARIVEGTSAIKWASEKGRKSEERKLLGGCLGSIAVVGALVVGAFVIPPKVSEAFNAYVDSHNRAGPMAAKVFEAPGLKAPDCGVISPVEAERNVVETMQALDDHNTTALTRLAHPKGANSNTWPMPETWSKESRVELDQAITVPEIFTALNGFLSYYGIYAEGQKTALTYTSDEHGTYTVTALNEQTQNPGELKKAAVAIEAALEPWPRTLIADADVGKLVLSPTFGSDTIVAGYYLGGDVREVHAPIDQLLKGASSGWPEFLLDHEFGHSNSGRLRLFDWLRSLAVPEIGQTDSPSVIDSQYKKFNEGVTPYAETNDEERRAETFAAAFQPRTYLGHPDTWGSGLSRKQKEVLRMAVAQECIAPGLAGTTALRVYPRARP